MAAGDFASLSDLATILGRASSDDLSAVEASRGTLLITLASGLITDAVARDSAWAEDLSPIPVVLRAVCLELVGRVMRNPSGARSESETLGQHQHSVTWAADNGMLLTDAEIALCRRAVWGHLSATSHPATTFDQAIELCETGHITT